MGGIPFIKMRRSAKLGQFSFDEMRRPAGKI
jgi:hypothetical protein